MNQIPAKFKPFFWDSEFAKISPEKNSFYIIERLAALGDMSELRWLEEQYPKETIVHVVNSSRSFPPAVAHFLSLRYQIPYKKTVTAIEHAQPGFHWYP